MAAEAQLPICFYHANCADGFTAAWAVWRALGSACEYLPMGYGAAPPDVAGRDVIMVDFSFKRAVIERMGEVARSIIILDHHETAAEDLDGLPQPTATGWNRYISNIHGSRADWPRIEARRVFAIFDMDKSGAELAWDFFHPGASRPHLIEYVADRDLWLWALPYSREISAAISSYPQDFVTWESLSARVASHWRGFDDLTREGTAILRKQERDIAALLGATRREMIIGGHRVPVANIPFMWASEVGNAMSIGFPFSATYFDKPGARVFSLRSQKKSGANVADIARAYGGGGHANAAGFTAPTGWEGDDLDHACDLHRAMTHECMICGKTEGRPDA